MSHAPARSSTSSYLQRLVAPMPPRSSLLTARPSASRGPSSANLVPEVTDALPRPLPPPANVRPATSVGSSPPHSPLPSLRDAGDKTFAHPLTPDSSVPQTAPAVQSSPQQPRPHSKAGQRSSTGNESSPQADHAPAGSEAPRSNSHSLPPASPAAQAAAPDPHITPRPIVPPTPPILGDLGDRGGPTSRVHIGAIEVRLAAPLAAPVPARDRSTRGARPPSSQPLSRPLAWSHGLVQG